MTVKIGTKKYLVPEEPTIFETGAVFKVSLADKGHNRITEVCEALAKALLKKGKAKQK